MKKRQASYGRRMGNTFPVALNLRTAALDGTLADHAVTLCLYNDTKGISSQVPCTVEGNTVKFNFTATIQKACGGTGFYTPSIVVDAGDDNIGEVDWYRCIEIVAHSHQEYSLQDEGVIAGPIVLEGDMTLIAHGLSAYEIWKSDGHEGTISDFIVYLQQPALDAAEVAREAAGQAQAKAELAARSAASAEQAESIIEAAERARVLAEEARVANESSRASAETDRQTSEAQRQVAESARGTNEQQRREAESGRTTAAAARAEQAANDHARAEADHTQAAVDHTLAGSNHSTAASDHAMAEADHTAQIDQSTRLTAIEGKIPAQASSGNQLADKAFVNSSIATATATYRGTYNLATDLSLTIAATQAQTANTLASAVRTTPDNNDYCYVQIPTADATPTEIARVDRYKFDGTAWGYEFSLNNSGYTAEQWAAINSGITAAKVAEHDAKYDKPASGIPENDLAPAVAKKLNFKEVFVAQYGWTTYTELLAAWSGGRFIMVSWAGDIYVLVAADGGTRFVFVREICSPAAIIESLICSSGGWKYASYNISSNLEGKVDKVDGKGLSTNDYSNEEAAKLRALPTNAKLEQALARKANIDGEYDQMAVGLAKTLAGKTVLPAEYICRKVPNSANTGLAQIDGIKGRSLVWNQQAILAADNIGSNQSSITITDGKVVVKSTGAQVYFGIRAKSVTLVSGHRYYLRVDVEDVSIADTAKFFTVAPQRQNNDSFVGDDSAGTYKSLFTADNTREGVYFNISVHSGLQTDTDTFTINNIIVVDLTIMFGEGNEPSTIAEFEALYPLPYYDYDTGTIINNKATAIEALGFNQWDEEWEEGGINTNQGYEYASSSEWRSKNPINLIPGETYFVSAPSITTAAVIRGRFFDGNNKYIGFSDKYGSPIVTNRSFQAPENARYFRFSPVKSVIPEGTPICINISDVNKNGIYMPHEKHTFALNIPTMTGKIIGGGESVTLCSEGLKSCGDIHDEAVVEDGYITMVIKRVGKYVFTGQEHWSVQTGGQAICDLLGDGSITGKVYMPSINDKYASVALGAYGWNQCPDKSMGFYLYGNSSAAATARHLLVAYDSALSTETEYQTVLAGFTIYYPLATPEVYILDTPVPASYQVISGGTERRLPVDTAGAVSAPVSYAVRYALDAVGAIQAMPKSYTSAETLDALLSTLGTALNGTITKTWDAINNKWTFAFAANT